MDDYTIIGLETEVEDNGFQAMEDGLYEFEYAGFNQGNHEPTASDNHSYPTVILQLKARNVTTGAEYKTTETLKMIQKFQWKISRFFASLGATPNPATGKIKPGWNSDIGKRGYFVAETSTFTRNDGKEGSYQNKTFLAPADVAAEKAKRGISAGPVTPQPVAQPAPVPAPTQAQSGWGSSNQGGW